MRVLKNGQEIQTVDDWHRIAKPKRDNQWVSGRSAFEVAYAWCQSGAPAIPPEVARLLATTKLTADLHVDLVFPEHRIRFDKARGEPRNADLAFAGTNDRGKVAVTIEAKADEPFDKTVKQTLSAALERLIETPRSRGLQRIASLTQSLFAPRGPGDPEVGELRYQLLTAAAGSLAFAHQQGASTAVLIVHEFVTDETRDEFHRRNVDDLSLFLRRLIGPTAPVPTGGTLSGPYSIPGRPLFESPVPLFVGKGTSNRRGLTGPQAAGVPAPITS